MYIVLLPFHFWSIYFVRIYGSLAEIVKKKKKKCQLRPWEGALPQHSDELWRSGSNCAGFLLFVFFFCIALFIRQFCLFQFVHQTSSVVSLWKAKSDISLLFYIYILFVTSCSFAWSSDIVSRAVTHVTSRMVLFFLLRHSMIAWRHATSRVFASPD